MSIETRRVCVISAAHLTAATWQMLHATPNDAWPVHGGRMGDAMLCVWASSDGVPDGVPDDLAAVLIWARAQAPFEPGGFGGFDYVMFDADADLIDALPDHSETHT